VDGLPGVRLRRLGIRRTACPMTAHHESPAALLCVCLPVPAPVKHTPYRKTMAMMLSLASSLGVWSSYACNEYDGRRTRRDVAVPGPGGSVISPCPRPIDRCFSTSRWPLGWLLAAGSVRGVTAPARPAERPRVCVYLRELKKSLM
jgi:hypothetical protein